jgi:secreted trypsin-like serine protease
MKLSRSLKGVFFHFIFVLGCAPLSHPVPIVAGLTAGKELRIVGGQLAQKTSPGFNSTVGIWLIKTAATDTQKTLSIVCSGTLIAADTVLTAAHCSDPQFKTRFVVFASDFALASKNPATYLRPITSFEPHPLWNPDPTVSVSNTVDLAVVHFSGGLPAGFVPAALYSGSRPLAGTQVSVMGYGTTDTNSDDSGTLREAQTEVVDVELFSGFRITSPKAIEKEQDSSPTFNQALFALNEEKSGPCHGDSGGPSYLIQNGKALLVGITASTYGSDSLHAPIPTCHAFAVETLVSPYISWLADQLSTHLSNSDAAN